jgi:hypothetical protein
MSVRLPEIGTQDRLEIEEIRERIHDAGYAMHIHPAGEGIWAAALHRLRLRSTGTTPWEAGETPLEAARNALAMFESRADLRSEVFDTADAAKRGDRYYLLESGTLIIRKGRAGAPWRLTWQPTETGQPGLTLRSDASPGQEGFPTAGGIPGVLEWAVRQPWFPATRETADDETQV